MLFNQNLDNEFLLGRETLEEEVNQKREAINGMYSTFKEMMKTNSKNAKCQTEEAIWHDNVKFYKFGQKYKYEDHQDDQKSEILSDDDKDSNDLDKETKDRLKKEKKQQQKEENMEAKYKEMIGGGKI